MKSFKQYLKEYGSVTGQLSSNEVSKTSEERKGIGQLFRSGVPTATGTLVPTGTKRPLTQKPLNTAATAAAAAKTSSPVSQKASKNSILQTAFYDDPIVAKGLRVVRGIQKVGEYIGEKSVGSPEDVVPNEIEAKKAVYRDNPDLEARQKDERKQREANRQQDEQEQQGKIQ